ncbi:CinA family protein [Opitutus sp. GAS368]|jgi:nicotinamide-nucleotide amidase|uniref:CinA family protein n=1 Tax=Opitutus sp. GAS368 TaxID=1882749 RepID=UPI00087D1D31|nr:CinA family protein [Opitutus sp. GAS368]SDS03247.1 nicotinamide-nucleotide amidase [Opitutus sp. GAS368]
MSHAAELKKLMMRRPPLTLAVAESLTAGHVQARIAAVSGASDYFLGGITAYTLRQKVKLLGVNRAHAKRVNCVSQRVAVEMAFGATRLFGADLAVATTGYAEPARAAGVKSPMAWWAICQRLANGRLALTSGTIEVPGANRTEAQARIADDVLGRLVAHLAAWRAQ